MSNSWWPKGWQLSRLLCLWDFPSTNTGMGSHSRQRDQTRTFCISHRFFYHLSHQGSSVLKEQLQFQGWSHFSSVQSLSRVRLFVTPMNHSTPGLPVHHQLPESIQTHVHWVGDAIQPSHPLSSPSPPALNMLLVRAQTGSIVIRWSTLWKLCVVLVISVIQSSFYWKGDKY